MINQRFPGFKAIARAQRAPCNLRDPLSQIRYKRKDSISTLRICKSKGSKDVEEWPARSALGPILAQSGPILAPSWPHFGTIFTHLGLILTSFWPCHGQPRQFMYGLDSILPHLGPILGSCWPPSWAQLGSSWLHFGLSWA